MSDDNQSDELEARIQQILRKWRTYRDQQEVSISAVLGAMHLDEVDELHTLACNQDISRFSPGFINTCVRLQLIAEVMRRMDSKGVGAIDAEGVLDPSTIDSPFDEPPPS